MNKIHNVTLIPGDGIGPEIVDAVQFVIREAGVQVNWEKVIAGEGAEKEWGTPLPDSVLESIRKNKVALKGPIKTPIGKGFRSINVALRKELDLFACLRPLKSFEGFHPKGKLVDLILIRENTEDLYAGVEFSNESKEAQTIISFSKNKIFKDANISIKPISRTGTERIARFAFEFAKKNGRKKVTAVTKANIMKLTDGLFYEVSQEVAKNYPDIEYEETLVDNMCMQLVQYPENYDVLLLPNLYGDIVSDLGAGLIGGLGVAPGANYGDEVALFEAVHGTAPKYANKNMANPTALLLSAIMMLERLGETDVASRLKKSVNQAFKNEENLTFDLGGKATTRELAESIVKAYDKLN